MKRMVLNLIGALAVGLAFSLHPSTAFAQGTGFTMLTITNPTTVASDCFGYSIAVVGTDRVLIGSPDDDTSASDAGAAYLFSTNGALLTAFTNPTPAINDYFGHAVAAVGTDRVLIGTLSDDTGASDSGAAYLFNTNGALLTTITNPTPATEDWFGFSVSAVGTDRVLIGSPREDMGPSDTGAAYLLSTNGVLLTTFINPAPAAGAWFGFSVSAVGGDQALIGAYLASRGEPEAGAAYLFNTNGALLTTFRNPRASAAWDNFGYSVAAAGTNRVLIGAPSFTGTPETGAAFLFSTDGTRLTIFTNPTPTAYDCFGHSVAAVGSDRVLVGAYRHHAGATTTGATYLFSTDGVLLTTFSNPASADYDGFGWAVAAVATDWVVIGAVFHDTGAEEAGAAYLFSLEPFTPGAPTLTIRPTPPNTATVSWPSPSTGWMLQQNTNGVASVHWSNAPGPIQDDGTAKTLLIAPHTEHRFYRLFKP